MQLEDIHGLVGSDLDAVDTIIAKSLGSDISLVKELAEHIFGNKGKRLRPILVILSANAFNYKGEHHLLLAAIVELIHTATLLHDDVVDASNLRRGKKTANHIWGNEASVLVGDYLYSRSFQMMVKVNCITIMRVLADAANTLAEGEVMQLMNCHEPQATEVQYMKIIQSKTATLFQAAAQLGPLLCQRNPNEIEAMANYGLHVGMAFQLIDDALDYGYSDQEIGKNIGADLMEGKPTLPLIYAMQKGTKAQQEIIKKAILNGCVKELEEIKKAIDATEAIAYTYQIAHQHVTKALEYLSIIPNPIIQEKMAKFAEFSVQRKF